VMHGSQERHVLSRRFEQSGVSAGWMEEGVACAPEADDVAD
jgi:hypothetical protein